MTNPRWIKYKILHEIVETIERKTASQLDTRLSTKMNKSTIGSPCSQLCMWFQLLKASPELNLDSRLVSAAFSFSIHDIPKTHFSKRGRIIQTRLIFHATHPHRGRKSRVKKEKKGFLDQVALFFFLFFFRALTSGQTTPLWIHTRGQSNSLFAGNTRSACTPDRTNSLINRARDRRATLSVSHPWQIKTHGDPSIVSPSEYSHYCTVTRHLRLVSPHWR